MRIYEQFQKSLSKKENADFLKNEYGWGGSYPVIVGTGIDEQHDGKGIRISKGVGSDKPHIDLNWNQVEKRIGELIKLDRYLNPKKKELYPERLEKQELRRAKAAEERRRREILSTAPTERKEQEQSIYTYEYQLGNTVYLGANEYEILNFDDNRVVLNDTQFPLMNKEMSREEFDRKVRENPMNDHLKVKVLQTEEKHTAEPYPERIGGTQDTMDTLVSQAESEPTQINNLSELYCDYLVIKANNPNSLVLYQIGDFFEAYGEDAQKVAVALDLAMTSRTVSDSDRIPMVGFPQHRLETYMNMLTDRGFDLAVSTVDGGERKVLSVVSTNKDDPVPSKPIGRIDYLHTDGRVRESIEYTSPYQFENDIKEENYYGVPMKIVLYKDKYGATIPQDLISQLDPPPQGVEIIDSPYLKSSLDIAKKMIDEYCREEFERDEGADYTNLSEVNVAYTTTEDDKHEIQANVNLVDFKIETLVDGTVIRTEQYDSLEDMNERGLKNLSFDDLVYLSEEELERVEKASAPVVPAWEQPKKSKVQSFDLHPEIPMADRHNFNLASHEIEEVGKKERFRRNMEAIRTLKECEQGNRFAIPDEQKILSRYVGWGGIPEAFDENNSAWADEFRELYSALSPDEYSAARESTLTAFYTPPTVIERQNGYKSGFKYLP